MTRFSQLRRRIRKHAFGRASPSPSIPPCSSSSFQKKERPRHDNDASPTSSESIDSFVYSFHFNSWRDKYTTDSVIPKAIHQTQEHDPQEGSRWR